jgi:predicted unusual protein kinase regulating ubiquinone biosynthesis (AarF/ABC1/UbiB family)
MSLALSPQNLKVYADILGLLWKYGNREAFKAIGLDKLPGFSGDDDDDTAGPEDLADDFEELGPTYVKIGQVLSAQLNILPPEYMEAMSRLQDHVKPFPFPEAVDVIEHGIGEPIRSVFAHIDQAPIGSASLGQVYKAELLDGSIVAVKVQRPGASQQVDQDFDALTHLASAIDALTEERYGLYNVARHTHKQIQEELDYKSEASNITKLRSLMADEPSIVVPGVYRSLCSERVIVMEFIEGKKVTSLTPRELDDIDGEAIASTVFKKYLDHILVEGFFHADPHPGNVLMDPKGRCVLLDVGMVGRVPPRMRGRLTQLVLAIVDGRGEDVAETAIEIGEVKQKFSRDDFTRDIAELVLQRDTESIRRVSIGDTVLEIASLCGEHHLVVPPLLSTIGKTLLNLDQLGEVLSPDFNPASQVRSHTGSILWKDIWQYISPSILIGETFEIERFLRVLPRRVSQIVDTLAREDKGFRIDAIDEDRLINGFEKIANRITHGLIIAALFISGAMIMNVEEVGWRFGGIPAVSWAMFIVAGGWVLAIIAGMLIFDQKKKKDR